MATEIRVAAADFVALASGKPAVMKQQVTHLAPLATRGLSSACGECVHRLQRSTRRPSARRAGTATRAEAGCASTAMSSPTRVGVCGGACANAGTEDRDTPPRLASCRVYSPTTSANHSTRSIVSAASSTSGRHSSRSLRISGRSSSGRQRSTTRARNAAGDGPDDEDGRRAGRRHEASLARTRPATPSYRIRAPCDPHERTELCAEPIGACFAP
jgi:hypothetical protein